MKIFISDVHLDQPQSKRYGAFLMLLESIDQNPQIEELYLMGDIFDLWLGNREIFFRKHEKVVELLTQLSQKIKIHYFEGNHDFLLAKAWTGRGVKVYPSLHTFEFDGKRILLSHGDLMDSNDWSYRLLRWFFRTGLSRFLIFVLPESWLYKIGSSLSTTDSKSSPEDQDRFTQKWTDWTLRLQRLHSFDVLIGGHYHIKVHEKLKDLETINLGSWLEEPFECLVYRKGKFSFQKLNEINQLSSMT